MSTSTERQTESPQQGPRRRRTVLVALAVVAGVIVLLGLGTG